MHKFTSTASWKYDNCNWVNVNKYFRCICFKYLSIKSTKNYLCTQLFSYVLCNQCDSINIPLNEEAIKQTLPYFIILLIFYVWMKGCEILLISSKYTQHLVNRPPKKHSLVMMYPKLGFFYRITTGYIFSSFSILKIPFEMPYFSNQKTHLFT